MCDVAERDAAPAVPVEAVGVGIGAHSVADLLLEEPLLAAEDTQPRFHHVMPLPLPRRGQRLTAVQQQRHGDFGLVAEVGDLGCIVIGLVHAGKILRVGAVIGECDVGKRVADHVFAREPPRLGRDKCVAGIVAARQVFRGGGDSLQQPHGTVGVFHDDRLGVRDGFGDGLAAGGRQAQEEQDGKTDAIHGLEVVSGGW